MLLLVSSTTIEPIGDVNARCSALLPGSALSFSYKAIVYAVVLHSLWRLPFAARGLGLVLMSPVSIPKALVDSIGL
jgi:hypothetical protein